ncbi:MAG: T9SS type A sorting domain-containing protein [Lentimicrobiaceae bacterium]|nr:T9SS type A sorting domain-containing protein [Lentimicrobiaceae bacterium]MCO5264838.1 T9SS type A sorting domain-containing protein [Lentimicrobium sp.]HPG33400.1 T9SS type A sorting domain-containing protein [Lentimicrobium sp.]
MKHLNYRNLFIPFLLLTILTAQCQSQQTDERSVSLRHICRLPSVLTESSGIAIEGTNRIWSHEDSGNSNEIYCFDTTGTLLRTLTISNVHNIDWEDMAVDNEETWYLNDAGNNNNDRQNLAIYKIPSPETISGNSVNAQIISFTFEDQTSFPPPASNRNFDIEAIVWHNDSLFLFTKDRSTPFTGITKMYVLPDTPGTYTARLADTYHAGNTEETGRITSADINHHTGELILLTKTGLLSFTNYPGNRFFDGEMVRYNFTSMPGQNESIGFVSTTKLYMTEEGTGSTEGYLYELNLPVPQAIGNLQNKEKLLSLYPNPATNQIKIVSLLNHSAFVQIKDLGGMILKQQLFSGELTLDISQLKAGVYFVSVMNETTQVSKKILKL